MWPEWQVDTSKWRRFYSDAIVYSVVTKDGLLRKFHSADVANAHYEYEDQINFYSQGVVLPFEHASMKWEFPVYGFT